MQWPREPLLRVGELGVLFEPSVADTRSEAGTHRGKHLVDERHELEGTDEQCRAVLVGEHRRAGVGQLELVGLAGVADEAAGGHGRQPLPEVPLGHIAALGAAR